MQRVIVIIIIGSSSLALKEPGQGIRQQQQVKEGRHQVIIVISISSGTKQGRLSYLFSSYSLLHTQTEERVVDWQDREFSKKQVGVRGPFDLISSSSFRWCDRSRA